MAAAVAGSSVAGAGKVGSTGASGSGMGYPSRGCPSGGVCRSVTARSPLLSGIIRSWRRRILGVRKMNDGKHILWQWLFVSKHRFLTWGVDSTQPLRYEYILGDTAVWSSIYRETSFESRLGVHRVLIWESIGITAESLKIRAPLTWYRWNFILSWPLIANFFFVRIWSMIWSQFKCFFVAVKKPKWNRGINLHKGLRWQCGIRPPKEPQRPPLDYTTHETRKVEKRWTFKSVLYFLKSLTWKVGSKNFEPCKVERCWSALQSVKIKSGKRWPSKASSWY